MPKLNAEQTAERRQRFIDAASVCFARDGFHKTTMADICAEAGLSVGAIYLYFDSKEAIIEAVVDERMSALQTTRDCRTIMELKEVIHDFLAPAMTSPYLRLEFEALSTSFSNASLHDRLVRNAAIMEQTIRGALTALEARGEIRLKYDQSTTARLVQTFIMGSFVKAALDRAEPGRDPRADVDALVDTLLA